jgi:hypothetical protein
MNKAQFEPPSQKKSQRSTIFIPDLCGYLFDTCLAGLQEMHRAFNAQTLDIRHRPPWCCCMASALRGDMWAPWKQDPLGRDRNDQALRTLELDEIVDLFHIATGISAYDHTSGLRSCLSGSMTEI